MQYYGDTHKAAQKLPVLFNSKCCTIMLTYSF